MVALRQRHDQIIAGPDSALEKYKSGFAAMEAQAADSGQVPTAGQISDLVTPLLDAVSTAGGELERLPVPARMRSALRNLDTAYAALGGDLRRLIALWPDAESTEQQESANGAQFSSAAAAFVADLDAGT